MGSLNADIDNRLDYTPKKKKPELTYEADVIAHLERELAGESNPHRKEELQSMLDDWKGFAE
jgi:hypothetical protein